MAYQLVDVEIISFYLAVSAIIAAAMMAWVRFLLRQRFNNSVLVITVAGVIACMVAIGVRWYRTGDGPFLTMYEVLISNLFSLGLIFVIVYLLVPLMRSSALVVLPLLGIIGIWASTTDMSSLELPATYDTALLWVHVGVGKVFLGLCMIAFGLAAVMLIRHAGYAKSFEQLPLSDETDELAWRFMAIAFVFHSLMLIAGAAWAQDAWGRFWAWDSLETWAFITWLVLGTSLHARLTWHIPAWTGWLMIICVFTLALLTFFGVPFSSIGPHKGII